MKWNSNSYDQGFGFVSEYGQALIPLLDPKQGETILDLGCGTGDLTAKIRAAGATVIGLDSSKEMIETAAGKYPDIQFDVKNADDFNYVQKFDAVFSNATLHWVLNCKNVITCVYDALKPQGRFVAELGGKGNVANINGALKRALISGGYQRIATKRVWYFPSLSSYATLLEDNGFRVQYAAHFDRPTLLETHNGVRNWLYMFARPYLEELSPHTTEAVLTSVEEQLRVTNFDGTNWFADYVRLRILAIKQ